MALLTADRTYVPGDLIYSEEAFAKVLTREYKDMYCEGCFIKSPNLKSCKNCLAVKYCRRACQRNDWPDHHLECKHLKNLPEHVLKDYIRLLGRIVLKIKGKDWRKIKQDVLGKEVSFYDIDIDQRDSTDPMEKLHFKEIKELLRRYIGDGNIPEDDDLTKIVMKVNSFFSRFGSPDAVALSFFLGSFLFCVKCIPNANLDVVQMKTVKIWANKRIKKLEKVSVSKNFVLGFGVTSKNPKTCNCADCSLPYGESVLTKIIDDKRAFSVIQSTECFLDMVRSLPKLNMIANLEDIIEEILNEQKGVLGNSNVLHLKVLSIKVQALQRSSNLFEQLENLFELEKQMKFVFGEYYSEMKPIYFIIFSLCIKLGYRTDARMYLEKFKKFQVHETDN